MSDTPRQPEVWLRGAVDGVEPLLMPVAHALLQAREDIARLATHVADEHTWTRAGGAASIGFHIRHLGGTVDRLFTYARGQMLSDEQKAALKSEGMPGDPPASLASVAADATVLLDRALAELRGLDRDRLLDERKVGRAGLPSNVLGLLFHAAEHTTRHVGQAITTAKIVSGRQAPHE
jgi:uncharacterized damage-inducible protein DinB